MQNLIRKWEDRALSYVDDARKFRDIGKDEMAVQNLAIAKMLRRCARELNGAIKEKEAGANR